MGKSGESKPRPHKPTPPKIKRVRKKSTGIARHSSGLLIRNADLSRSKPAEWVWQQRVLRGYFNLQVGEEGIGKGNLAAWIAARLTRGELPGDLLGAPSRTTFIGDEDAWDDIWVPRLSAVNADLDMVTYVESGASGVLDVSNDSKRLQEYIEDRRIQLVYFDQLLDNLGYTDNWKDKQVRDTLAPLKLVARNTGCAMLASMHPNKRDGSFRDRISGSPAFNALSRSSLLIAAHPSEPDRVVVARGKGNYSAEPPAFEFRIEAHTLQIGKRTLKTSRLTDPSESDLRAADLLAGGQSIGRSTSQAGQARSLLYTMFADREIRSAREVLDQMEAEGFPERVTQEARRALGIETWKQGYQGSQMWGYERPVEGSEQ